MLLRASTVGGILLFVAHVTILFADMKSCLGIQTGTHGSVCMVDSCPLVSCFFVICAVTMLSGSANARGRPYPEHKDQRPDVMIDEARAMVRTCTCCSDLHTSSICVRCSTKHVCRCDEFGSAPVEIQAP